MSTEVAEQAKDQQPEEQPQQKPSETAKENGDSSSKPQDDGDEVKSKSGEKEAQSASDVGEPGGTEPTTCSPLEEKIIRQVEVGNPLLCSNIACFAFMTNVCE